MDFPFTESALTERRTAVDLLNEDLSTVQQDLKVSEAREAKLRQELADKESDIQELRITIQTLEEDSLRFNKSLESKDIEVCFCVSPPL